MSVIDVSDAAEVAASVGGSHDGNGDRPGWPRGVDRRRDGSPSGSERSVIRWRLSRRILLPTFRAALDHERVPAWTLSTPFSRSMERWRKGELSISPACPMASPRFSSDSGHSFENFARDQL